MPNSECMRNATKPRNSSGRMFWLREFCLMKQMFVCDTITMCIASVKLYQRVEIDANGSLMLY